MSTIIKPEEITTWDRQALFNITVPKETDSYAPVPHRAVIETTLEALDKANFKVLSEKYVVSKEGRQVVGSYQMGGGDSEMGLNLMFHNSYDKSMPLRWAIGGSVFICRNGVVSGDIGAWKRKHTGTVLQEFREESSMYVNKAGDIFEKLKRDKDNMKEIEITKRASAELIGRMFIEEQIITATQIGIIKREIENPSFDYGIKDSLWNTYNAVTVALKDAHPTLHLKQHMQLHEFIGNNFKLV